MVQIFVGVNVISKFALLNLIMHALNKILVIGLDLHTREAREV